MPRAPESIPPGLRYLIDNGHAADGSHGENRESTQELVNPAQYNPTRRESVLAWVRHRARADAQMQDAGRSR